MSVEAFHATMRQAVDALRNMAEKPRKDETLREMLDRAPADNPAHRLFATSTRCLSCGRISTIAAGWRRDLNSSDICCRGCHAWNKVEVLDGGGSTEAMADLNRARDEALREVR